MILDPVAAICLDPHLRNGFYIFDDRIYLSKIEALIAASQKKSDIQYYYNDHVYRAFNWQSEPYQSLPELYKQQAQHIRDRYDHVILMFSGGSDSTNMLHSFLDNHIKVDAIWTMVAYTNTCNKQDRTNVEVTRAAWPILETAASQGVPVELINLAEFDSRLEDHWWMDATGMRLAPDVMMRKNIFFDNPSIKKLVDQGKRVAVVWGYDKPRILLDGDRWCVGILDTFWAAHWKSQHSMVDGPFFEFFYYSPDMPQVLSKSCHEMIRHFERRLTKEQCRVFFNSHNCRLGPTDIEWYRQQVNLCIYNHSWDEFNTFSLGKNSGRFNQFYDQKCEFVIDHHSHWKNFQTWQRGIETLQRQIDGKFYVEWSQINGHWSRLYPIKPLSVQG